MPRSRSPGIGASDGGVMAGSELNREKEQVDEEGDSHSQAPVMKVPSSSEGMMKVPKF